jgi:hypothetical protein
MPKLVVPIVNFLGIIIFLSAIDSSLALSDNVFADVADVSYTVSYTSSRGKSQSGSVETTGSARSDVDISNGIYRGEASVYSPGPDDQLHEAGSTRDDMNISNESGASTDSPSPEQEDQILSDARSAGAVGGDTNSIEFSEHTSCEEDTENLLEVNEDIRLELSVIDQHYLENASIENACNREGKISSCNFDFREYPSNLQMVCEKHGGNFYRTEHSIQCYDLSTMESLYYQFDYYPSCFSAFCGEIDAKRLVIERIDSITQTMSEFLEMTCFADDDILRSANDASLIESSGSKRSWQWIQAFSVVPFLLILIHSK